MTRNETGMKVEEALFGVDAVAQALIDRLMRYDAQQVEGAVHNISLVNLLQNEVKRALKLLDGAEDDEGTSTDEQSDEGRGRCAGDRSAWRERGNRPPRDDTAVDRARDHAQMALPRAAANRAYVLRDNEGDVALACLGTRDETEPERVQDRSCRVSGPPAGGPFSTPAKAVTARNVLNWSAHSLPRHA